MTPQEVAERALATSRTDGCIVLVQEDSTANLRWAGNTLTTNGVTRGRELTVIAVRGEQLGAVSVALAEDEPAEVETAVRSAEQTAAAMPAEDDAMPLVAPAEAALTDWEAAPETTGIAVLADLAHSLGDAFAAARAAGHALYGYAEHELTTLYLATSTGVRLRHAQPAGRFELTARAEGRSAWHGEASTDFRGVDAVSAAAGLTQRLEWATRSAPAAPGRVPVLLSPSAVADLMLSLYWSAGARDAVEGRTAFSRPSGGTRVGERIARLPLRLFSDPNLPGQQCAPFVATSASSRAVSAFDNGLAVGATDWIRDGVLTALQTTRHSAARTGLPIHPYVDNLRLEHPAGGPGASLADMVARCDDALLITCLWYIREVDPQTLLLTGLTRDGVYRIRGGEVVGAVTNFRFNDSPLSLLDRVSEVGATVPALAREWADYFPRTDMPALRVPDFHLSSVSPAS